MRDSIRPFCCGGRDDSRCVGEPEISPHSAAAYSPSGELVPRKPPTKHAESGPRRLTREPATNNEPTTPTRLGFCKILGAADFARSSAVRAVGIFSSPANVCFQAANWVRANCLTPSLGRPRCVSRSGSSTRGWVREKPAYDLMVPKDWQFKGWVNVGVAVLGCWCATAGCFWRLKLLNYIGCKTSASLFASACEARISRFAELRNLRSTSVKLLI